MRVPIVKPPEVLKLEEPAALAAVLLTVNAPPVGAPVSAIRLKLACVELVPALLVANTLGALAGWVAVVPNT